MTLDLVILGLTCFFALWGFFSGAAKQLATLLAGAVAWGSAGPAGQQLGPLLTRKLSTSALVGTVLATLAAFAVVLLVVQLATTWLLRRLLAGRDPSSRTLDRVLGFALGGGKVLAVLYVALCAMSFLEKNVSILGRPLAFTPKDSQAMTLVHRYNLLERRQFSGARELVRVARLSKDPKAQAQLKADPAWSQLSKDPRFTKVLNGAATQRALETGDMRALLSNNEVFELIQDSRTGGLLERLGEASD
ncbi:MAG: CvpA family protein [Myxococcaceae bacterium]|nr:CvpA family protein [Myxococcaceae bacterium]